MISRCPKCNSRNLRFSHLRNAKERLGVLLGIRPIRCRDCRARFVRRTWRFNDLKYARCPKCLQMDLSTWSLGHYKVSAWKSFLVYLGANTYRCEYCRHNFISLRRRKYKFNRRRQNEKNVNGAEAGPPEVSSTLNS